MPKAIDITGQRYGRLVALNFQEHRFSISGVPKRFWRCKCDCGNECVVDISSLRRGCIRSCGCLKIESDKNNHKHTTHGQSKTRLYKIWVGMKKRCNDEWGKTYKYYGGKGVKYADEWEYFEPFRDWSLSNGYSDKLTLDRIDSNGDYEPSNCRWVDMKTQANNTNRNHRITYKGITKTLTEWSEEYNISYSLLQGRVNSGWDFEEAIFTPPGVLPKNSKILEYDGKKLTINGWSRELGISRRTISDRLKMGLPIEQVLSKEHIKKGKFITYKGETHNIKEWSEITGIFEGVLAYRIRQGWDLEDVFNMPVDSSKSYKKVRGD